MSDKLPTIIDNRDENKVLEALRKLLSESKALDVATGYFEIGSLLALDGVVESAVPAWIPPAMPWEEVERKFKDKVPARAKRIRGTLNVPRERFRDNKDGAYLWAGEKDG